jgi:saccharopine dehydrogenase-like NADP-dependent oxidoreductase
VNILIVGGYGIVGTQIAGILRRRNPEVRIVIGGRSIDKARRLADALTNAEGVAFDVDDPASLSRLAVLPSLIIVAANDLKDATLQAAILAGVPLIDITRWTERVRDLEAAVAVGRPTAAIVQGSSWMACVPGALTQAAARGLDAVESIDISILYALKDISGDNSVEYMDRLTTPFPVTRDGKPGIAIPYTEARQARFANGYQTQVYRFDSPDQHILPRLVGARSVAARIAFDDKTTMTVFWMIIRSGLWNLLSGARFKSIRRAMLHNPGPGAPHHVRVDIAGRRRGKAAHMTLHISDAESQSHMTAVGAALQAEWVLGLNGFSAPGPGLHYGESMGPQPILREALAVEGIQVEHHEDPV